jgi:hypothetical protein
MLVQYFFKIAGPTSFENGANIIVSLTFILNVHNIFLVCLYQVEGLVVDEKDRKKVSSL